jgi:hypothetical protein
MARGAGAGVIAAGLWAAQQPLDKRAFGVDYDDVLLLGRMVARGRAARPIGLVLHLSTGAAFGAAYSALAPRLPLPAWARGPVVAMAENVATWPLTTVVAAAHPARDELPVLWGSGRAFAQACWRHLLFGTVLGEVERRLNGPLPPPPVPAPDEHVAATNGHGNLDHALSAPPA